MKLFKNLIIFFVIFIILDYCAGFILEHLYFNSHYGAHHHTTYALEKTEADILVFGSSRANHHYVPEIYSDTLGLSFYNTGRDGYGIFYQYALMKIILKRYTPKIIIFDFYGDLTYLKQEYDRLAALVPYCKKHPEIKDIVYLKSKFEKVKILSKTYRYNSMFLRVLISFLDIDKFKKPNNNGYIPLYTKWKDDIKTIDTTNEKPFDPNKVDVLRKMIKLADESGAKLYVCYSPIFQIKNKRKEIQLCREICEENNVTFWDYSDNRKYITRKELFGDIHHLNHEGAKLFSRELVQKILEETNKK